jgi:hypothetical protein
MALGSKSKWLQWVALGGLLLSCGAEPKQPAKSRVDRNDKLVDAKPKEANNRGPICGDGTCVRCGDAECPKGFFCDESTSKPNCQWVPTCSAAVSCECVQRALSEQCRCTERDGGAYVRCTE